MDTYFSLSVQVVQVTMEINIPVLYEVRQPQCRSMLLGVRYVLFYTARLVIVWKNADVVDILHSFAKADTSRRSSFIQASSES